MRQNPTYQEFANCLNHNFRVQTDATTFVTLQLIEAEILSNHAPPETVRQSFSLIFCGPPPVLPQGIYVINHETLGEFPLFIVPIASGQNDAHYQAIFN